MITRMDHTGFVVKDLDKSTDFYLSVVGLKLKVQREREGGPISDMLGYQDTHLKVAHLSTGEGHALELIQYVHPEGAKRPSEERSTLGASHLAFNVDDIEKTFQHLVENGARKLHSPVVMQPGRKACYLQDPDGNWIELIESNE